MQAFKTDIIIFMGILLIGLAFLLLNTSHSTIDIQLYDTYFVIEKISMSVLIVASLTFLIFFVKALLQKFNAMGPNIGLMVGLLLAIMITSYWLRFQQSNVSDMAKLDAEGLLDQRQSITAPNKMIYWTWALMSFWLGGLLLLIGRTVRVWRVR